MTPDDLRVAERTLEALSPGGPACRFLFAPDGGDGEPVLHVVRGRLGPEVKLGLIRQGATRFVAGEARRAEDGAIVLSGEQVDDKRVAALVRAFATALPVLAGARVG